MGDAGLQGAPHRRVYREYRDVGFAGVRRLPAAWQVLPLKRAARLNPDTLSEEMDPEFEFDYVDIGGVTAETGITSTERMRFSGAPSRARRRLAPGDVIISTVRTYLRAVALVGHVDVPLVGSTGFAALRPHPGLDARFLWRALSSSVFIENVVAHSEGIGYPAISPTQLVSLPLIVPPLPEQQAIAAFLDRETARIDALVTKNEFLIEKLTEERASTTTMAVTKGLVPERPMVRSGFAWIGGIPEHWSVERVKHVARLESGHTPSRQHPEYWENCTTPWFTLGDVWQIRDGQAEYVTETAEKVSALGLANSAARLLPKGTVMLSRTASVGFSAIMGVDMATTQDFVNWVCGARLLPEYLLYVFRAMKPEFERLVMGSTHQTIYMPDVGRMVCPVPPIDEQREIVTHIRRANARVDRLVAKTQALIDRLREYRAALITAAVTGQIDVRGEVAA